MRRTVLVTGAGSGIGHAVAARFAGAGDTVVITGRRRAPLERAADAIGARAFVGDASDPDEVGALRDALPDGLDVLVNNAGGNTDFDRPDPGDLHALAANWRANLAANLLSAVLVTEAVTPRLSNGGSVIHIGSIAADTGAGSYGAAKAALASWNVGLARDLGARGVTSNVVAPGYIADTEFFRDRLSAERRDRLIDATHDRRPGRPEDIAETVHFLASPAARHITGQVLHVNGGALPTR